MHIDWLTVVAQIVNFLVLVWLLERLLYRPVVAAMQRREQSIASRISDAERREREATQRAREYSDKSAALERTRQERLETAAREAETEKRRLLEQSRAQIDEEGAKWRNALQREHADLRASLKREVLNGSVEIARRALRDLADASLEDRIVTTLLGRLEALPQQVRESLVGQDRRVRVISSFDLTAAMRERLAKALGTSEIDCEREDGLICGIELRGSDHKLDWSIDAHVDGTQSRIDTLLGAPTAPDPAA